jgi:hypothetical protein
VVTFGAVGDIVLAGGICSRMKSSGLDWPFASVKAALADLDVLFGNMESVFIPEDFPARELDPAGLIATLSGEDCGRCLADAGFTFLNMASNHVLDAGEVGLEYTRQTLAEAGVLTGGTGATQEQARDLVRLEQGGISFGFLCYCEDGNYTLGKSGPSHAYYTPESVLADIATHRESVDILVVSVHADIEFMDTPSYPRLLEFREFARAGAKIILGHHPHVLQGCEMHENSLIAHSLGNFVFPAHSFGYVSNYLPRVAQSMILKCEVSRQGVESFERIPVAIDLPPNERPVLAEGPKQEALADRFLELDALVQDEGHVRRVWQETARRQLESLLSRAIHPPRKEFNLLQKVVGKLFGVSEYYYPRVDSRILLDELIGRALLVRENRNWAEEIFRMSRERWREGVEACDSTHRRPSHSFARRRSSTRKDAGQ